MLRRTPAVKVAVIGNGVEVKASTIPGALSGLFASRFFAKNEIITEYDGKVITEDEAKDRFREHGPSHLKTLLSKFAVIDGNISPAFGRGGGSFANDVGFDAKSGLYTSKHPYYNVVYVHRTLAAVPSRRTGMPVLGGVWLKATRDIAPGEEIFVSYGKGFWTAFNSKRHKCEL